MSTDQPMGFQPELLIEMMRYKMPFGKYKDTLLSRLPVSYLEWFAREGFPQGKLGILLQTVYEIKINGLDYLFDGLSEMLKKSPDTRY